MILRLIFALVVLLTFASMFFAGVGAGVASVREDKRMASRATMVLLFGVAFGLLGLVGLVHG